ncbi:MAG: CoA transferase [Chloroflexi bacterium]|nr:CoA transferase [Chloroflexota bacterium]
MGPKFAHLNHGKHSDALNHNKTDSQEKFKKLVRISDVVVDNFRYGVMQKWGFDYPDLKKIRGDIIVVSMRSLGKGPYQDWVTWGENLLSFSGFSYVWGHPETPMENRAAAGYYNDFISGSNTAAAILAALFHRANTGQGQYIEVSQAEVCASALGPAFVDYFVNGRITEPRGNRHPEFAPYNSYPCRGEDSWCVIAVFNEEEWQQFCRALDYLSWTKDAKFRDMSSRLKNVDELDQNIGKWTKQHTPRQVMKILQSFGVAAGAIQNAENVYYDIQLRGGGSIIEQELPRMGSIEFSGVPRLLTEGQITEPRRRTPPLGEHNDYVYRQLLGLSQPEIDKLTDDKVIF